MAKTMRTPIIKFNLKQRMRQFNGAERNFDIPKLVKAINSEQVQERVRLGDLNGFYGHHARIQFGAEPQEGGIVNGQYVHLEPCCRTVYLKAYDDGTVEHQQEFFATELGVKAWQRLQDRSGGFSSVITTKNGYNFHGFDYVNEPNYSGNRPYTLDSVADDVPEVLILDDVESVELNKGHIQYLMDGIEIYQQTNRQLSDENKLLAETLEHLKQEHAMLLDDIVILKEKMAQQTKMAQPSQGLFDNTTLDHAIQQANRFKSAKLEQTEDMLSEVQDSAISKSVNLLMRRWGY